jgi:TolB-like protein/DNA-binding winged helix-turn-helix (wHTH) protein
VQAAPSGAESPALKVTGYRIGDLIVHLGRAEVARDGKVLPVAGLSFDLLVALARAAPDLASLDDLLRQVWPKAIVSPETLSQRVKLLRDALGDDAQEPRYVAGVRGRGYRLIAPVELLREPNLVAADPSVAAQQVESATPSAPSTPASGTIHRRPTWAMVLAGLIIAAAAMWWTAARHSVPAPGTDQGGAELPPRSIAVLPFKDIGKSPDGEILALGIPEAVLHQLAGIEGLDVIARTSSFSFQGRDEDVRSIGRQLNTRYLLEGSVQRDQTRVRVTTQLVDTRSGDHVWSMQFDRPPQGIFELQDAIALEVARALSISLSQPGSIKAQGTVQFDAYLEYLQGVRLLATWRVNDMKQAGEHAAQAIAIDPKFAAAHVLLASAKVRVAEYAPSERHEAAFREALRDARVILDHALTLDPRDSRGYAERGYVNAFSDIAAAETDYRKALELNPSDAQAAEGLAEVLNLNPARLGEALQLIERARHLDPLEPRLDVTKATFLFLRRSDFTGAEKLLKNALQRDPMYEPALSRLAELYWQQRRFAEGIKIAEQVLAMDTEAIQPRQILISLYLDIEDIDAADDVLRSAHGSNPALRATVLLAQRKWPEAGEKAYLAAQLGTIAPAGEVMAVAALRMQARTTREYLRTIDLLADRSHTEWDAADQPIVRDAPGLYFNVVGLGDLLIQSGHDERGRKLLESSLAAMDRDEAAYGMGGFWHYQMRPLAMALLGRHEEAIAQLQRATAEAATMTAWWYWLEQEPAYAAMREDPRFKAMLAGARNKAQQERTELQRLRANGLVPNRGKPMSAGT